MDIGKKIKEIRVGKMMTQTQLVGDEITRNMLSRIENGAALPSLGTVMYLAKRLGVPAGALLSEDDGAEYNFKKSSLIKKIKEHYSNGKYEICLDMCVESSADEDDEISYIAASCCINLAQGKMLAGKLYEAGELLCKAVDYAKKPIFDTQAILSVAYVLIDFMRSMSPMLDFDVSELDIPPIRARMMAMSSPLCRYINVLGELERGSTSVALAYVEEEDLYAETSSEIYSKHVAAKLKMLDGDHAAAYEILRSILDLDGMTLKLLIYLISRDAEICCREMGDYRGAYEFSETKIGLIESMLRGGV